MALVLGRNAGWLGRFARGRRERGSLLAPLLASRDLPSPPIDPETRVTLPRSPEPLPEEALRFIRNSAPRAAAEAPAEALPPLLTSGAELRFVLEQVEDRFSLREAIEQAKEAHRRLSARLDADRASRGAPRPLDDSTPPAARTARREAEAALADALALLKRISAAEAQAKPAAGGLTNPRSSAPPAG